VSQLRIAYFVNQYPKVSHTFIRREIQALERQGFAIQRIALRGWDNDLVDEEDVIERERTRYVLRGGIVSLMLAVIGISVTRPVRVIKALLLAFKMGMHADRPWPFHLIYFAEACRIVPWLSQFRACHIHAHFGSNSTEVVGKSFGGTFVQFHGTWDGRI
jgi:colanic acid/amylovoran biosynthesis glycosyltransferase